jgi:hypothetical protein
MCRSYKDRPARARDVQNTTLGDKKTQCRLRPQCFSLMILDKHVLPELDKHLARLDNVTDEILLAGVLLSVSPQHAS